MDSLHHVPDTDGDAWIGSDSVRRCVNSAYCRSVIAMTDIDALIKRLDDMVEILAARDLCIAEFHAMQLRVASTVREAAAALKQQQEEIARLSETWTDDSGSTWTPPTAWAYAQVCVAHESLRTQLIIAYAKVSKAEDERDAMTELARWLRSQTSCEHYHHDKKERHTELPCPVEARIDAAIDAARGKE
jgi:hypothetical protein